MILFNHPVSKELKSLLGKEIGVSDWVEITQDRIDAFADVTGDRQWIHVDREKAAKGPLGGTVAHGLLLLSLLPPLLGRMPLFRDSSFRFALNYGLDRVRFIQAAKPGDLIRTRAVLKDITRKGIGRILLKVEATVEIANQERPALVAEILVLLFL